MSLALPSRKLVLLGGVPPWVLSGAALDLDFANGRYYGGTLASLLSISRASSGTDLLPSSAAGASFTTFGSNVLRITPGSGLLIEEARTNQLLNSGAPVTQTTASLGTGSYTLWVNGSGSALASGGTATITGAAVASNGSPNTFTVTVAGTVVVTVTGSLNQVQLEAGAFGTSYIPTTAGTVTRAADVISATGALLSTMQGAAGSVVAAYPQPPASAASTIAVLASASGTDLRPLYMANNLSEVRTFNGSVALNTANAVASANKQGLAFNAAGRSLVLNNGTIVTDANTIGLIANLNLGSGQANRTFDGYVSRLTLWSSRLADATLKALTV